MTKVEATQDELIDRGTREKRKETWAHHIITPKEGGEETDRTMTDGPGTRRTTTAHPRERKGGETKRERTRAHPKRITSRGQVGEWKAPRSHHRASYRTTKGKRIRVDRMSGTDIHQDQISTE